MKSPKNIFTKEEDRKIIDHLLGNRKACHYRSVSFWENIGLDRTAKSCQRRATRIAEMRCGHLFEKNSEYKFFRRRMSSRKRIAREPSRYVYQSKGFLFSAMMFWLNFFLLSLILHTVPASILQRRWELALYFVSNAFVLTNYIRVSFHLIHYRCVSVLYHVYFQR